MSETIKLPPKQEIFALAVFQGDSQRTAYRKAYPTSNKWTDEAVDVNASKLCKDGTKVSLRLSELREKAEKKAVVTLEEVVNRINEVSLGADDQAIELKANDMLMKHLGGYEKDNKLEIASKVNIYLPKKRDKK